MNLIISAYTSEGTAQIACMLTQKQNLENPHKINMCLWEIERETFEVHN